MADSPINALMSSAIPLVPEATHVDARELHGQLGVGRDFANWIKSRIDEYGFVEGEDFSPNLAKTSSAEGGRPRIDYALSLEMAKELCLLENNDTGRRIRRQLIESERQLRTEVPRMLAQQAQQLAGLREMLLEQKPLFRQALRYHAMAELSHQEKARLMGWKTAESWRKLLHEMSALGLVDYQPNPSRVLAGQRGIAAMQEARRGSEAHLAAARKNIAKGRAAQAAKRAAR